MRTYTIEKTVYRFEELSDAAKERAKEWYLSDDFRAECLHDSILYDAKNEFPESDIKCQFSLASCQGDGVNIYGSFYLPAILENVREAFTEKEYKRLIYYMTSTGTETVTTAPNNHYCYDDSFSICFTEDIENDCENLRDYDGETVARFNDAIREAVSAFCSKWKEYGYKYLYEIDEDEMRDICDANGYEFTEDGMIF